MTARETDSRNIRVMQFLDSYERQNCLWNQGLESYKNKTARNEAYMQIIEDLNIPNLTIHDVKRKVKSIRTTYTKELRVLTRHKDEGKPYTPKLFWFNRANAFLRGVSVSRDKRSKIPPNTNFETEGYKSCVMSYLPDVEQNVTNNDAKDINNDCECVNNTSSEYDFKTLRNAELDGPEGLGTEEQTTKHLQSTSDHYTAIHTRYSEAAGSESTNTDNILLTTTQASSQINSISYVNDECDFFCSYAAAQLRKISDPYSRSVAKLKIQQILFEAETGHYRNNACITIPVSQE